MLSIADATIGAVSGDGSASGLVSPSSAKNAVSFVVLTLKTSVPLANAFLPLLRIDPDGDSAKLYRSVGKPGS